MGLYMNQGPDAKCFLKLFAQSRQSSRENLNERLFTAGKKLISLHVEQGGCIK